tara:strand:- start:171 stop:377 length:207 start_codon:yes stop_codon:yes gene_type:complete
MKKSKKTLQNLEKVQEDLNKVMDLLNSMGEIDEDYDIKSLDEKIDNMQNEMDEKYKELLSENDLDPPE